MRLVQYILVDPNDEMYASSLKKREETSDIGVVAG